MIDVSIIVVGTNEKEELLKCLDTIRLCKSDFKKEVIVIDNASTDGTSETIEQEYNEVILIKNKKKMGYIINNNMAMKRARGRYYLLINSDIYFQENTIQVLYEHMESDLKIGVCTCKLTFPNGDLQYTVRRFPTPWTYFCRIPHFFRWIGFLKPFARSKTVDRYLMSEYDHQHNIDAEWFLSALFFLRKKAVEDVGLLDEKLVQPFYLEDMDWCYRAHMKKWKVRYITDTSAIHDHRRGSVKKFGKLSFVHMANILIFFKNHLWSILRKKHLKQG